MNKKIGRILLVVGIISLIPISLHLFYQADIITVASTAPPVPAGIGGWVKDIYGEYVDDDVVVTAENLQTGETATRYTQNGYYAIPISARTGDRVKVVAMQNIDETFYKAEKTITVDLSKPTQWCNLTLGSIEDKQVDAWLLLIPFSLCSMGLVLSYVDKKKF